MTPYREPLSLIYYIERLILAHSFAYTYTHNARCPPYLHLRLLLLYFIYIYIYAHCVSLCVYTVTKQEEFYAYALFKLSKQLQERKNLIIYL